MTSRGVTPGEMDSLHKCFSLWGEFGTQKSKFEHIGELLANIKIILTLWLERGRGGDYIWLSLKGNAFHDKSK